MINFKKKLLSILVGIIIVASLVGCGASSQGKPKDASQSKSIFYLYDKGSSDVYALSSSNEKTKLTSNVQSIQYVDNLNSYIAVDNNNDMYLIDSENNKDKISSNVNLNSLNIVKDKVYFVTNDSELYVKEKSKDKNKIASDIINFKVIDNSIIFLTKEQSLFLEKDGQDKNKIASNVTTFEFTSDLNNVAYVSDGALYLKNIKNDTKDKLNDSNDVAPYGFASGNILVYWEDVNSSKGKGELYYKKIGEDKKKLASDIKNSIQTPDGVFYVDDDRSLYFKDYKGDDGIKILDDVDSIRSGINSIFAIDKDKNLYTVNTKGEKTKLNQDIVKYEIMTDSIASTNKDKDLYVGNNKVASDVLDFCVNGKELAYINNSNEVYLIDANSKSKEIISDAKEYQKIQFNNCTLFKNTLSASDITGYWKSSASGNAATSYLHFSSDCTMLGFANDLSDIKEIKYTIENATENSFLLNTGKKNTKITKIDNDNLTLDNGNLIRITEEEFNTAQNNFKNSNHQSQKNSSK